MKPEDIKQLLILMFKADFDIDKKLGIYNDTFQSFTHDVSMQFKDKTGVWDQASLSVEGLLQIDSDRNIKSWNFNSIDSTLNGIDIIKIQNWELG
jgi:hypothetical protein